MQRKLIVSLVLIVLFLLTAVGGAVLLVSLRPPVPRVDIDRPPLLVTTHIVHPESITEWIEGYGTATADRLSVISAQVAGEIVDLPRWLRAGVDVQEGRVIMRLDDRDYQLALQRARSKLAGDRAQLAQLEVESDNIDRLIETAAREVESMRWEYEKVQELYEAGTAPKREYAQTRRLYEQTVRIQQELENRKALLPQRREQLEAMITNDQAEIESAELNLARTTVTAPFDGRVSDLKVEIGERVQVGTPLMTIIDPRWIDVPIELPLAARDDVRIGSECVLSLESDPELTWVGEVHRIAPKANEQTRTFRVYSLVDNAEQPRPMIPGLFLKARVEGPLLQDALVIPRGATRRDRVFVYDPRRHKARRRDIEIVEQLGDRSVVTGLEEGERIITSNLDALYDGISVRIEDSGLPKVAPPPNATANLPMDGRSEAP